MMIIEQTTGKCSAEEETQEKRRNLVKVLLQSGGDPSFCGNSHVATGRHSYPTISPEMRQVIKDVIEELDSSDAEWRIHAKKEGMKRAENAAKEATRWANIWEQRFQDWKAMRDEGSLSDVFDSVNDEPDNDGCDGDGSDDVLYVSDEFCEINGNSSDEGFSTKGASA